MVSVDYKLIAVYIMKIRTPNTVINFPSNPLQNTLAGTNGMVISTPAK